MFRYIDTQYFKSSLLGLLFLVLPLVGMGQFNLNIKLNPLANETDTLNLCPGDLVIFKANAVATYANGSAFNDTTSLFTWYFGGLDKKEQGIQLDSLTYTFNAQGGQYVLLRVQDKHDTVRWAKTFIKVSLKPRFTGTHPSTDEPLCKGDNILLTGAFEDTATWKYQLPYLVSEDFPLEISNTLPYQSALLHDAFGIDTVFRKENHQIDSVCVYIEHSALTDLEFKLRGPDSTLVTLKSVGGNDIYLGEPIDDENDINDGEPYKYCWTTVETDTYMNSPTTATLAEGNYLPEGNFDDFEGENLNGEWTLIINDNAPEDNGFVLGWELHFSDSILPLWNWESVFEAKLSSWMGGNVSGTNTKTLTAFDTPANYGSNTYIFMVYDVKWGCPHATSVLVNVEKPTFDASATEGQAPIDIDFTNTTIWAQGFEWFVDGNEVSDATTENTMHTYEDKGLFATWLIAESDQGCTDISDTIFIDITVPVSEVTPPNVFTPNSDGINDRYIVKTKALNEFKGYIYNRNGRRVHMWRTLEEAAEGWDGTLSNEGGMKAAEGVYFYVIKAVGKDEVKHIKRSTLYLIR